MPSSSPSKKTIFEEHQRYQQVWVWITIFGASLFILALFAHALYQQLYLQEPWGNTPVSDRSLKIIAIFMTALALALPLLLRAVSLNTRVDGRTLHVHFRPFRRRAIPVKQITRYEAVTYRPLIDYGGWGIRFSLTGKGWAYNICGNKGVRLTLANGKRILIGSQRAEELAAAIAAAKNR